MKALSMLILWLVMAPLPAAIQVIDARGQQIVLSRPAQRIVSLAPHVTELIYSVGAGERLIAVVNHSDYPPAAGKLPRVGGYNAVDVERIVSLQPDLVVAWQSGNNPEQLQKLERLGLKVFVTEPRQLTDISETLRRLARLTGTLEQASDVIQDFDRRQARLQQQYSQRRPPVSVFYQIWNQPLMTVSGEHLISDVIRLCGGRNVFPELLSLAAKVSVEAVIARSPQVIIIGGMAEQHPEWIQEWRQWSTIPAVRRNQLYTIDPDHLQRHTVRILEGAETLCRFLDRARQ